MACKEEKVASMREANIKAEASVTSEQQKKIHEKVDKCKQDSQKVRVLGSRHSHRLLKPPHLKINKLEQRSEFRRPAGSEGF